MHSSDSISIRAILLLLLLLANQSECFTLPNTNPQQQQPQLTTLYGTTAGNPALLDAITNFFSSSPEKIIASSDACRIFHGRGGLYPGADHLALDYYPPVFLLTSFHQHLEEEELNVYGDALGDLWEKGLQSLQQHSLSSSTAANTKEEAEAEENVLNPTIMPSSLTWVYQSRAPKGQSTTQLMSGQIPDPHIVTECNGQNKFLVHLAKGQNHGLFLDMAMGRRWLQQKCINGEVSSVLNLFAYTCAFSIAALNGGAQKVVNVDMSHGALKVGQRSHGINGVSKKGGAKFLGHDLFKSWGKLKRLGPYDCVVVDPPSYQKGSFIASKDYIKVIRRLPSLLNSNGWALVCLNAPELDTNFLLELMKEGAPDLCFVERLDNPPAFASAFSERDLKVLVFQCRQSSSAASAE
ncbi:hypothetical protein ACHAXR_011320 [Thalassiosira sp. AJA248-18]